MVIFSIVIPTYNEEKYIEKCLKALNKLNYPKEKYEIIVVDNNSTDKTVEFVKKYKQVKVLKEKSQGISFARQKGLNECNGKYYVSIDADTVLPKNWLLIVEKTIKNNPNFACIFGPVWINDSNNIFLTKCVYFFTKLLGNINKHIYNCNAVYNTNKLKSIGGFDTKYKYFEDGIVTIKFKKQKEIIIFNKNLKAYISGRRYKGLSAFSVLKNLSNYYIFQYFNKIPFKSMSSKSN